MIIWNRFHVWHSIESTVWRMRRSDEKQSYASPKRLTRLTYFWSETSKISQTFVDLFKANVNNKSIIALNTYAKGMSFISHGLKYEQKGEGGQGWHRVGRRATKSFIASGKAANVWQKCWCLVIIGLFIRKNIFGRHWAVKSLVWS